ncbi:OmpA family protein [Kribbella sp. NPDC004536]|uniref:OmpA family protein n=1 Tax=Kribbella sp. NPDC004536 TaxID=3364106 RepID=UPI0036B360D9
MAYGVGYELEYETPVRLRIRIVRRRAGDEVRESEGEFFDPVPPPAGARLLTRFDFGSWALTRVHRQQIVQLATDLLRGGPMRGVDCLTVNVTGHEDEIGDPARFGATGMQRATAVAKALADEMNRQVARLPAGSRPAGRYTVNIQTLGPTRPMRSNLTADGRALNRRVEVTFGDPVVCPDLT